MTYRDGRPNRYTDYSSTLWTCAYDQNDFAPTKDLSCFQGIPPPDGWIISDARVLAFRGDHLISLNLVRASENAYGYESAMHLYNIGLKTFTPITFIGVSDVEKNYCFFSHGEGLFFTRNIWNKIQEIYSINPSTGEAILTFSNAYESEYDEQKHGNLRHSSHPARDEDLLWTLVHSHTGGTRPTYNIGICNFDASPPFKMRQLSNAPLLDTETTQIVYPVSLSIKEDTFYMGVGIPTYDEMDIISFTRSEIVDHLAHGVTYPYPAEIPHMQEPGVIQYGPTTRVDSTGWRELWGAWSYTDHPTSKAMSGPGWAYACLRRPLKPGRYYYRLVALCSGAHGPILSVGFSPTNSTLNPGDVNQAAEHGKVFASQQTTQTYEGELTVSEMNEYGFWSYYYGSGTFKMIDAKFTRIDI